MSQINNCPITELIRISRPLFPDDTIERAVAAMRAASASTLPVVSQMQTVGLLREQEVVQVLATRNGATDDQLPRAGQIMKPLTYSIPATATMQQAAEAFSQSGEDILPVVNPLGQYSGYLVRNDITAALSNVIRPAMVGGLATPLGVHLTCGSQRGGVSDLGLFCMGALFGLLGLLGILVAGGIAAIIQYAFDFPAYAALLSEPAGRFNVYDVIQYSLAMLPMLAPLAGIRFSRVAGYHAAEHQTVHAIEQGEPLTVEVVSRMPRVHPRCGTNLIVAAGIFVLLMSLFPSPMIVFAAILVALLAWRSLGPWMQRNVTTRKASTREIESGIKAGRELLDNYRLEVIGLRPPGKRLWNLGFVQIMMGMSCVQFVVFAIIQFSGVRLPFL